MTYDAQNNKGSWPAWATEVVQIVPYDSSWPAKAMKELDQLRKIFGALNLHVTNFAHIGSTAVPGLAAKPVIDLIAEIENFDCVEEMIHELIPEGWHYVSPELDNRPLRRFFIKVENNKRIFHLQLLLPDSSLRKDQIRFRDLLLRDERLQRDYATLKQTLSAKFVKDREGYTDAKSEFIKRTLSRRIRIIFATNNAHKVKEIQAAIGESLEVVSLQQAGINIDIPEPYDTLEENAQEKAATIHQLTAENCFSEDTGLEVVALNGEPGVKSARYAGEDRDFNKNVEKLLEKLGDKTDRSARFRTVISLVWERKEYFFKGICNGRILSKPKGIDGFGYDPVFTPEGDNRSFAEMTMEEKNRYSHRRKAADQMVAFLRSQK